ncbi:hypothetical protein N7522_002027 [Penicillium canescens]|uniref:Uncharacterized protein n=1 Tax=Penicillium canescens TaxID=5083 RepID=A0AAD6I683_PENCN|nr:uncharacterized protein N7446_014188 [Penicillium canescens]KAJ6018563.1 hypothetical protein N7522_002027 [Penicillium canescens]KAJ6034173.1 hypothetical protein N7460_009990 [Penicillium canescens]KAJ6038908.1 hypothetical protein N7446_014188 [Penicillium canescens]KAJ6066106.1 hypothetical protein N7444_000235 [Penicillium canescens]KAJ6174747.1 hypothetical protein N7485_005191 [Penicillium canescens]
MSRALFTEEEVQLASERRLKYIGTAKVSISQIQFDPPLPRDLDPKNLDRLRRVFRQNRCRRLDVDNHVPAIVSPHDLADALRKANISQQSLLTTDAHQLPRISFLEGQLLGLHGRHRVQAGAEVLPPADRWWTVDLYSDDIGAELRASLVEEYANERKPTDGEIYRKIRQYEGDYDETFRERWFVRLSRSNQERLDQLDNKKNRRTRGAFDRLLTIPGLWPGGMRISVVHRLIASGCVEETVTYLHHIWDFWSSLVASDHASLKRIDQNTVELLQLLAPGKSRTDGQTACGMILSGQAFAEFSDEERRIIWSRMQNFDSMIPSLYTFFEDFKYLEACAHCVKRLCGPIDMSIWRTMSSIFNPPSEEGTAPSGAADSLIQTSESTFRRQPATDMERLETGYLQIWLYAMRHYTLMPPDPKSDDELLAKSTRAKPDERAIYEMAELAQQLGFQSTEIDTLIKSSPDHQIARSALLQARKPKRYRYDSQDFDLLVNQIVSCFAKAVSVRPEQPQGLLADSAMKLKTRSGEPQTRTHKQGGPLLFLDRLHTDVEVADNVTSFFVRRCVYFAFFGKSARIATSHVNQSEDIGPDQGMGEMPPSPMFVEEDDPPVTHTPAPDPHPPHGKQGETQERTAEVIVGQGGSESQQPLRTDQKEHARRRRLKFQIRPAVSRPEGDMHQEPMELELPEVNHDQVMLDRSRSPEESSISVGPQSQPEPVEPATVITQSSHVSAVPDVDDSRSDCTRVSLDAVPLVEDQEEQTMVEEADKDDAPDDQTRVDGNVRRVSPEPEASNSSVNSQPPQENLDEFLASLRRAQEEQEQLEERLENERLNEEFDLPGQPPDETSRLEDRQDPSSSSSENLQEESATREVLAAASETTTDEAPAEHVHPGSPDPVVDHPPPPPVVEDLRAHTPSAADHMPSKTAEDRVPQNHIEVQLWSLERGEWRRSDRLHIDPSNPSLMERVAQKCLWKNYSLYDKDLHNLRPAQCYRAATADGSNALFVVSEHEEKKLADEGRLVKEKNLLWMASRVLDRVEDGRDPRHS